MSMLLSLNNQLEELEGKQGISSRWMPSDPQYEQIRKQVLTEKMLCVRTALWSSVVKWHYLLRTKAKYAGTSSCFIIWWCHCIFYPDGQKIAKKLCSSISKETKAAKKLFQEYSTAAYGLNSVEPLPSFGDILQPQADFWVQHKRKTVDGRIPWKTREDIIQAFLIGQTCEEEMIMLKSDMLETITYWSNRIKIIAIELTALEPQSGIYQRGVTSVLHCLKRNAECQHQRAVDVFSKLIDIPSTMACSPSPSSFITDSDSDTDPDSDSNDSEFF